MSPSDIKSWLIVPSCWTGDRSSQYAVKLAFLVTLCGSSTPNVFQITKLWKNQLKFHVCYIITTFESKLVIWSSEFFLNNWSCPRPGLVMFNLFEVSRISTILARLEIRSPRETEQNEWMIVIFALLVFQTTADQRCFDLSKGTGPLQSFTVKNVKM